MITNDDQLQQALEQLGRMYRALAALRADVLPVHARKFALMAEGPLDEIRRLQTQIGAYTGVEAAEEHDADVWLRLYGRNVEWPAAPTSVLTATLEAFRKGLQTVAELISTGHVAARPKPAVRQACDMRVVAFRPGSLRVGLRLPDETDVEFGSHREKSLGYRALVEYLTVAAWVSSGELTADVAQPTDDAQKRRPLFNALEPLVPHPRGDVERIEISGPLAPDGRTIRLTREAHSRLLQLVDLTIPEQVETYTGHLREIDLDRRTFTLRDVDEVGSIRCTFADALSEVTRSALGHRVRVTGNRPDKGKRGSGTSLHVSRLAVLADLNSSTDSGGHSA